MRRAGPFTPLRLPPGQVRAEDVNRNLDEIRRAHQSLISEFRGGGTLAGAFNYAQLRSTVATEGDVANCYGRTRARDGGEGQFIYGNWGPDDDGIVIGKWKRIVGRVVLPEWFGASETSTTNSAPVRAAMIAAYTSGLILRVRTWFTCESPIELPPPSADDAAPSITIIGSAFNNNGSFGENLSSVLEFTAIDGSHFVTLETVSSGSHLYTIILRDVALVGPDVADVHSASPRSGHGIWIKYDPVVGIAPFIKFENVTVMGFKGGSGYRLEGCNNSVLKDCYALRNGIGFECLAGFNGCTFLSCHTQGNLDKGAYFESSYGTNWFGGVQQNVGEGVVCDGVSAFGFYGLYFEGNNQAHDPTKAAFRVGGAVAISSNIMVEGSTFGSNKGDTYLVNGGPFIPVNVVAVNCRLYNTVSADGSGVGPGGVYVMAIEAGAQCGYINCGKPNEGSGIYYSPNNSNWCIDPQITDLGGQLTKGGETYYKTTTDATPTVVLTKALGDNKSAHFVVTVTARRTGGARGTGAAGDVMTFRQEFAAAKKGTAATAATLSTVLGTAFDLSTGGDLTAAGISIACTGSASGVVTVTATGAVGLDLQWAPVIQQLSIS